VHNRKEVFAPETAADVLHRLAGEYGGERTVSEYLHSRKLEILKLIREGMSNKNIADELNLNVWTVSTHLVNIFRKLKVSSLTEVAVYALKKGLIKTNNVV